MIREREDVVQRKIEKEIGESKRLEEKRRKKEEEEEAELQRLELEAQLKQEEEEKERGEKVLYHLLVSNKLFETKGKILRDYNDKIDSIDLYINTPVYNSDNEEYISASNGLEISLDISILYQPLYDELGLLHQTKGQNYLNSVLLPNIRAVARSVVGRYTPEQLYSTKYSNNKFISFSRLASPFITVFFTNSSNVVLGIIIIIRKNIQYINI